MAVQPSWSVTDWTLLFVPLATGWTSALLFPTKSSAGSCVEARPPPPAFGIVWTILYMLIGWTWVRSRQFEQEDFVTDVLMALVVTVLFLWVMIYNFFRNPRAAMFLLLIINMLNFSTWSYVGNQDDLAGTIFAPYVVWCLFALGLNAGELQCSK